MKILIYEWRGNLANEKNMTDLLVDCTVRIISYYENGSEGSGTGFFYEMTTRDESSSINTIITNKHVVDGAKTIELVMTKQNSDESRGGNHTVVIENVSRRWILHPEKDIDLAMLPIGKILENLWEKQGVIIYHALLNKRIMPSIEEIEKLKSIEDIVMIGYPNGLWDSVHNTPIMRKGITATPAYYNYENKPEIVIDVASFPGSSGSPVFIYNDFYYTGENSKNLFGGGRLLFLGVLYSGFIQSVNGEIVPKTIPTSVNDLSVRSQIPINLGIIIRADKLRDFEDIIKISSS